MRPRRVPVVLAVAATLLIGGGAAPAGASGPSAAVSHVPDSNVLAGSQEYAQARSFPADWVSAGATLNARQQADQLNAVGGRWTEQTTLPYNAEPAGYTDPIWSNAGAGAGIVGGRVTSTASDGNRLFAGAADGGVWRSDDGGTHWRPISDHLPSISIGALAVNPDDHTLWIGTGEANTNSDSYLGMGVYRMGGEGEGAKPVGGGALLDTQVFQLTFDGRGSVYAATTRGLFKTSADGEGSWATVLQPDPTNPNPPYPDQVTTVVTKPGTGGAYVAAVVGWRNGSPLNGFFESTNGGTTFTQVTPTGDIDPTDIGRTTFGYGSDGRLVAIVESPALLAGGGPSVLQGVFVSSTGAVAGPWKKIADESKLEASGSALSASIGYGVGVQAWYNQSLAFNPANPAQFYIGLEEVFQTNDGGTTWTTASPYWNYGLACGSGCPKVTHPDQHAAMVWNGQIVIGNDGGMYRRPLGVTGYGSWTDLNATLRNLQYYDAAAGNLNSHVAYIGGLQDNGVSVLPGDGGEMYGPASGDGFMGIVDPMNANRWLNEYVYGASYYTTDGGHTYGNASPSCEGQAITGGYNRADCDAPGQFRFSAPITTDQLNVNHWITAGRHVWMTSKGWTTQCPPDPQPCDWKAVFDLGAGHSGTAVTQAGSTAYAAWVRGSGNPAPGPAPIRVGIATNYGGTWHQLSMAGLPGRFIQGLHVDTANPAHVYAIFNGFSRRWIPGGGQGIVFESKDGGSTWTNISGNLPDAPGDALVVAGGQLVLATDIGVFTAPASNPTTWARLGENLPNVSVNNLTIGPDGQTVVAATHGRGIWTIRIGGDGGGDGNSQH